MKLIICADIHDNIWVLEKALLGMAGEMADIEMAGRRLALNHYPEIARGLAQTGLYDLVFYGHDHLAHDEEISPTRLFNPGELMGRLGTSTFAILDLATGATERVEVPR